jgi:hypothetical protein
MNSPTSPAPVSKTALWIGRLLPVPAVLMLLMSGVMKIAQTADVVKGFADWPPGVTVPIGVIEIFCTLVYLLPRTSVIGAILLTGYLGGATAVTVRMGTYGFAVMPVAFGVLLWGGLFLRDPRIRALIPLKS